MIFAYMASCLLFTLIFHKLGIIDKIRQLLASLRSSFAIISDRTMSDREKELAIRSDSLRAGGNALKLTFFFALTAAAGAIPPTAGIYSGLFTFDSFLWFSLDPIVLILTCAVFGGWAWGIARLKPA